MELHTSKLNTGDSKGQTFALSPENSFFAKHNAVSNISKKTEKIATAIYMVTDFMPDWEPLKRELRNHALGLLTGTRAVSARSAEARSALADEVVRTMEDTVALVTLASTIGLVSGMNARILASEIGKAKEGILRHYGTPAAAVSVHPGYANVILSEAMFETGSIDAEGPAVATDAITKRHDFDIGQNTQKRPVVTVPALEPQARRKPEIVAKKTDIGIKIARRNDVLNVVRSKGKVSIKDITTIMKDMGEKTVQRELLALVKEGVLSKEGEKRWSTYRIAS